MELEPLLKEIAESPDVACVAVIDARGAVIARAGDFASFPHPYLISAMLGPYGNPVATFDSLSGQTLPKLFAQGGSHAVLDKPTSDAVVAFFLPPPVTTEQASPIDTFRWARRRGRELANLLRAQLGSPPLP